ncbi:hypothetical protein AAL_06509 [Moelleriella libera RCEF 2490]|uniref:Uncharacterized protein n=1 Tax=Moelleriella libera RCEF 2490 TaxID=1081109 RepID=A0A167YTV5_9HYPO|nr:hypothetical protein AAL_06509 [Moelleriella libera RCEF 2490]
MRALIPPLVACLVGIVPPQPQFVRAKTIFSQPPASGPNKNFDANPVYRNGDSIDVHWSTDLDAVDLVLRQVYPNVSETPRNRNTEQLLLVKSKDKTLRWTVNVERFNLQVPNGQFPVFSFAAYQNKSSGKPSDGKSHYFNVTEASGTVLSGTSPTVSPVEASLLLENTSSLSGGAVAGITIGAVTVGGILVLLSVACLLWARSRRTTAHQSDATTHYSDASHGYFAPSVEQSFPTEQSSLTELSRAELAPPTPPPCELATGDDDHSHVPQGQCHATAGWKAP